MTGLIVCALVLALATVAGLTRKRRDGRLRPDDSADAAVLTAADLGNGAELGARATFVQFSTEFCQPCRATRRLLSEVAAQQPGVIHLEIDAEQRLDLVRRFQVLRTPTVLVLDTDGRVVQRASGPPRKADVLAALGQTG
ncbi:thioredoxin family protein [Kitasatospora sp. NPDC006697]|uniref:thioredoxin family protein n=1 Tax=Kitasatospora sp. NPDC006697 TaxID=3364020 RepID=UPI0036C419EA